MVVFLLLTLLFPADPFDHGFSDFPAFVVDWVELARLFIAFWKNNHTICFISHSAMRRRHSESRFLLWPTVLSLAHYIAQFSVAFHLKLYLSWVFNLQVGIVRINHMLWQIRWGRLRISDPHRWVKVFVNPQHRFSQIQIHPLNVVRLFIRLSLHLWIIFPLIKSVFIHHPSLFLLIKWLQRFLLCENPFLDQL